jgi:hypothetical protein
LGFEGIARTLSGSISGNSGSRCPTPRSTYSPHRLRSADEQKFRGGAARGRAIWTPDQDKPLQWAFDGQTYIPSGLSRRIYRDATGEDVTQDGPKSWLLGDGRDLFPTGRRGRLLDLRV